MFRTIECFNRLPKMHHWLQGLLDEMAEWCLKELGVEIEISETVTTKEEDDALNRKSASHREGRAFDVATRKWTKEMIEKFCAHFSKYNMYGAISLDDGVRRLIVTREHGSGPHAHVQMGIDVVEKIKKGINP